MLLVDYRAGSKDLIQPLRNLGLTVEEADLPFGDVVFVGRGVGDTSVNVGVEFKKVGELIQSIRDGRFAGHQLQGLSPAVREPIFEYSWLLVEGQWSHTPDGLVGQWSKYRNTWVAVPGSMSAAEYEKHLLTFELCGEISVAQTNDRRDTLRWLVNLAHWWVDKAFDDHRGHLAIHTPGSIIPLSDFRQAVSQWPGIGVRTSLAVEAHFGGSIRKAASAGVDEWASMTVLNKQGQPRRFGIRHAEKLVTFLTGAV